MTDFISICIFARNEERHLPQCIHALDAAAKGIRWQAHIMVNGCTDDTENVARTLAKMNPDIHVHTPPVADKANAWNDYVFRIADPEAMAHIFLDGDIMPSSGAISALATSLEGDPGAFGAAAMPATGRSRKKWAHQLLDKHYLSGNLYALSSTAIKKFRSTGMKLPFGAKGEDGLITYLLLTDFKAGTDDSHTNRIIGVADATFEFNSLGLNPYDLRIYHRRLQRYSERHFQKEILYARLKSGGSGAMPDDINTIYTQEEVASLKPRLDPVNFIYDCVTLKRLRSAPQTQKAQAF